MATKDDIIQTIYTYVRKIDVLQKSIDSLSSVGVVTLDLQKQKVVVEKKLHDFLHSVITVKNERQNES